SPLIENVFPIARFGICSNILRRRPVPVRVISENCSVVPLHVLIGSIHH
ncbi:uncharacterized protein METZ01_LOCUS270133, partial [marine metagenome]